MTESKESTNKIELVIISQDNCLLITGRNAELEEKVRDFCAGNFKKILTSDVAQSLFTSSGSQTLDLLLQQNVDKFFDNIPEDSLCLREIELLLVAVSCLQLFVQNNWLGPSPSDVTPKHILPEYMYTDGQETSIKDLVERELSVDGEPVYSLTTFPEFLYVAHFLLSDCRDRYQHLQTAEWWLLRCINVHQQILDDKSNTLRETVIQLIDNVVKKEPLMTDELNRDLQMSFHLEAGHLCHMYYRYREAHDHFNTAKKLAQLDVQLTGAMGKRTKFQEDNKAQLLLQVTRQGEQPDKEEGPKTVTEKGEGLNTVTEKGEESQQTCTDLQTTETTVILPKNLNLEDDTVLDAIKFTDDDGVRPVVLSDTEQAMILGLMEDYRRSRASDDELAEEEVHAYLNYVLDQVKCWSVSMSALLLRSKLERSSQRRVDRSMRQLEELYNDTKRPVPTAGQRLPLFYTLKIVPVWEIHVQLAAILVSLGAIGSALEIYERLELWEAAISCYQRLGKTEKAETVIRDQLAIKETPNLLCFLGDVTQNIEHYEKAWEMSKHRSARAQRCMAYLYFTKEEYEKCLECFEKSLNVNSLQVPVWFTYGCAAMADKNYRLAANAFQRCVSIDYDNFEAWSNLAASYIRLKEKNKAFLTLKDAIKCNYENWRIWENFLLAATDCGEFNEAIQACHRLMDLKDRWVDKEVLTILVRAVTENLPDSKGKESKLLEPKVKELFGRLTSKVTDNADVWRLYAKMSHGDVDKTLQYLQKAHRSVMQTKNWERTLEQCQEVSQHSLQLADAYLECCSMASNTTQALQMMSSAKLMLRGVLTKIKQEHTDAVSQEIPLEAIQELCTSLDDKLTVVVEKITEAKGQ